MTISTAKGNPTALSLMFFCLVICGTITFFVTDGILKNESVILVYTLIIVSALITSLMYISISLFFTHRLEKRIMNKSNYIENHNINLFIACNPIYILKLKKGTFEFYYNHIYLHATQFSFNRLEYILKLKSRFATLNKIDILFIYLYKYISIFLSAVFMFMLYNKSYEIIKDSNTFEWLPFMFVVILVLTPVYLIVTKIIGYFFIKIMKKRDLEFFMYN